MAHGKAEFSASLLQSSSEIILICWYVDSCAA